MTVFRSVSRVRCSLLGIACRGRHSRFIVVAKTKEEEARGLDVTLDSAQAVV